LFVKIFSVFDVCYDEVVLCIESIRHLRHTWPVNRKLNVRTEYFTLCSSTAITVYNMYVLTYTCSQNHNN